MAPRSWPEVKYPSKRDEFFPSCDTWLSSKRIDDGAEGLWRVYDKLYDLKEFICKHPGGALWLEVTKGTDITEAFEVHHLTPVAERMLPKYYVGDATTPRNSPFTFHENGFFKTIKRRVLEHYDYKIPKVTRTSKIILDFLFFPALIFAVMAARFESIFLAVASGMMFSLVINCGHNFTHMKDMWRNYYYYFIGISVREWRIFHCISHHLYPNTLNDLEVWFAEPWFQLLKVNNKPIWIRYGSWLYWPVILSLFPFFLIFNRVRTGRFYGPNFLVFLTPWFMLTLGKFQLYSLFIWIVILLSFGFIFSFFGITAGHHDYEIFHEGDRPRKDRDWGLYQVDAILEKKEITGNKYLGLLLFGEHTLHHLFPTLDCLHLEELSSIYQKTLKEFGLEFNEKSYPKMIMGTLLQLARDNPNFTPRDEKKLRLFN